MGNFLFNVQVLLLLKLVRPLLAVLARSRMQTFCVWRCKRTLRLHLKYSYGGDVEAQWAAQITRSSRPVRTDMELGLSGSSDGVGALVAEAGERSLVLPKKIEFCSTPGHP